MTVDNALPWAPGATARGARVIAAARQRVAHLPDPRPPLITERCGCRPGRCDPCEAALAAAARERMVSAAS